MKGVILEHYQRYPKSDLEDFIKLIYQNSFGPKHMSSNPSLDSVKQYLKDELLLMKEDSMTGQIESIGNKYYRVPLSVIHRGLITEDELADAFYQSMLESPIIDDETILLFTNQLNLICLLIEEQDIDLDLNDCKEKIERYLDRGIRPLSHSDSYRNHYQPHYRVVHESFIKNHIEV